MTAQPSVRFTDESEVGFGIFYAISGNSGRHWDITETIEKLGYRPQDDAETYAEEVLAREQPGDARGSPRVAPSPTLRVWGRPSGRR